MTFGATTVVLIVLLLPGFAFLHAVYNAGRIDRDTTTKSVLAEFAGVVLVAIALHGTVMAALVLRGGAAPGTPVGDLLALAGYAALVGEPAAGRAERFAARWPALFGYIAVATAVLWLLGALFIKAIDRRLLPIRLFHGWTYELLTGWRKPLVLAYVLTRIEHDGRHLMYRGFVDGLRLTRSRRIEYLVLVGTARYGLAITARGVFTDPRHRYRPITPQIVPDNAMQFVIDGEDIANIAFETIRLRG